MDTAIRYVVPESQTAPVVWDKATKREFTNVLKKFTVTVEKTDAETKKAQGDATLAGAKYGIYDGDKLIDTYTTDKDGKFTTKEYVCGDNWTIREIEPSEGYLLNETVYNVGAEAKKITIAKEGEVFYGVNVSGGTDDEGNEIPTIYQPVYETAGLKGATYEIRAAEDIITPDGTVRNHKGDLVDTVTTGNDGFAKSKALYLGKYEIKEIHAPYGMVLSDEIHNVELSYADQTVEITETSTSFYNERQKVNVNLEKWLETNEPFDIGTNEEIKNISFGLFATEELVSASGTTIPADGLIEIITLDENGNGFVGTDLPFGSYYVKELATDEHYILTDTKFPVVFEYEGENTKTVDLTVNDGEPITNELIYGTVSGKKIDENGEALGGAVIGLFKSADAEFTAENATLTTESAEDGSFTFGEDTIPYGTWYVREIEQPTGFVLNDTVYPVTIGKDGEVVEIEIVNEHIRGNVKTTKVDADYPDNKLTGAEFEIYSDTNADGKLDKDDKLLGEIKETDTGIYEMDDLVYGHYLVKEKKAPDGFVLDENTYPVFIETDGKTYDVENDAGKGFLNEAMKGSLKIVKTSSDNKVEGISFRVTGENGYDKTFKTDKNGEILIEGSQPDASRTAEGGAGTVRSDEEKISVPSAQNPLYQSADEGQADRTLGGNRTEGAGDGGTPAQTDGSSGRRDRETESGRSVEVDTPDEQPQTLGAGDRAGGSDLRLNPDEQAQSNEPVSSITNDDRFVRGDTNFNIFDEEGERRKHPFFGVDEVVNEILATTPHLKASLEEIRGYFESYSDIQKRTEYIRSIFNDDFTEIILADDTRVGYKTYENGLLIWKGRYPSREGQSFHRWDAVAGHFEAMRMLDMLHSSIKPFTFKNKDLKKFTEQAKRYGVLYTVLRDKNSNDPNATVDVIARAEDASKIQRIADRFEFSTVDKASIVKEVEKKKADREEVQVEKPVKSKEDIVVEEAMSPPPEKKENAHENPDAAKTDKNPPSRHSSGAHDTKADKGDSKSDGKKPSVKEKLERYKAEHAAGQKKEAEAPYRKGRRYERNRDDAR